MALDMPVADTLMQCCWEGRNKKHVKAMGCAMTDVGKIAGAISKVHRWAQNNKRLLNAHIKLLKKFDSGIARVLV